MDSKKAYEQDEKKKIVDRESAYLCTEIERALDRIITYGLIHLMKLCSIE